jgi:predicted metal-dependent peptidase
MGENGLEHLIYYLDVSGSVSDAVILRFNSEVRHIHQELRPKRLTLVTFDTRIQDIYEFSLDDPFEEITVTGRGGTSLAPVYEHIKDHQPTAAVIFSDLYCTPMQESPGAPVLWVIIGNPGAQTHFGKNIHMPLEE